MRRMMADENIPMACVKSFRLAGHDVVAVADVLRRAGDQDVLAAATQQSRLLVTFDQDFGALAFDRELPAPNGILLLRLVPQVPAELEAILLRVLAEPELVFEDRLTVVARDRVRQRRITLDEEGAGVVHDRPTFAARAQAYPMAYAGASLPAL